jgi:DNA-binding MarR family transcriptional regulator
MISNDAAPGQLQPIDDLDPIIHSSTRLKILAFLAVVESAEFTFLLTQTGLTRGNLSPNLRKLEEAGYVSIQKEFVARIPRTLIRLTPAGRAALQQYSQAMQRVLDELLGKKSAPS